MKKLTLSLLFACWALQACAGALTTPPASTVAPVFTDTPVAQPPLGSPTPPAAPTLLPGDWPPRGAESEFSTDFRLHSVPYTEILSGGVAKDGIPAIDAPKFVSVSAADGWLRPEEPIVFVQVGEDARAFPIQILMWHEIANAEVGGLPLAVTFCPLCNTAIVLERHVDGRLLDFGTTGRLRFSNLIMYDRQTETWWQQATGEAIAGQLTGAHLAFYPASIISWEAFKAAHPAGQVLSRDTGHVRSYGRNPYIGYDDINRPPFLYAGPPIDGQLPPMARVVTVDAGGEAVAYAYDLLAQAGVVNDSAGGLALSVFWTPGTASALDASSVAGGRDVGAAAVFERALDGQLLTFALQDGAIVDEQTGSRWNIAGQATAGQLAGQALTPVTAVNHFWFSWAAFRPDTRVYQP